MAAAALEAARRHGARYVALGRHALAGHAFMRSKFAQTCMHRWCLLARQPAPHALTRPSPRARTRHRSGWRRPRPRQRCRMRRAGRRHGAPRKALRSWRVVEHGGWRGLAVNPRRPVWHARGINSKHIRMAIMHDHVARVDTRTDTRRAWAITI